MKHTPRTAPVLAILQNQWFKDPERIKAMYAQHGPEFRRRMVPKLLFMGSLTGKRLLNALGDWCNFIEWEEASPQVAGHAAAVFPADRAHLAAVLERVKPAIVITFGRVAAEGVKGLVEPGVPVIESIHPTARSSDIMAELNAARVKLEAWASAEDPALSFAGHVVNDDGAFCRVCWGSGRALWTTCCKCTGDVKE